MRHRILLIEDSPANRAAVVQYLDTYGFDCDAVSSLEEARALIDGGQFCAILTDLEILPTSNATKPNLCLGYAVIEYARLRFPASNGKIHLMPILVMSAHAKFDVLRNTTRLKADDFLKKPPTDLNEVLSLALARSGRQDHARCADVTAAARVSATTSSAPPAPAVESAATRLRIVAGSVNGRTQVKLGETTAWLTSTVLRALLHLAYGRLRTSDGWVARADMGRDAAAVVRALSRLRVALGQRIDDADKTRGYRLRPDIRLDPIPTTDLARMPGEAVIARLAQEIEHLQAT
jgi:CheY-like chemotaxis protein